MKNHKEKKKYEVNDLLDAGVVSYKRHKEEVKQLIKKKQ